jgi:hypothetical protein
MPIRFIRTGTSTPTPAPVASDVVVAEVAVSSTAVLATAAAAGRVAFEVFNPHLTNTLYYGSTAGVTSGTGTPILPEASAPVAGTGAVYLVCASGQTISAITVKVG